MLIKKPKKILVAPLDWGLGHTTRCVPLVRYIQSLGHRPVVAGNEWQQTFIKAIFQDAETLLLEGYDVTYSRWNRFGQVGLLSQLPRLNKVISREHNWLKQIVAEHKIDGIISDNRYGLFHASVPSVIMTHQVCIQTGMGHVADRAVQRMHYKYLERFNDVWVVDTEQEGLGGALSHSPVMPARTTHMGLLSQFEDVMAGPDGNTLLVLLSGPEPQRSELSCILWEQVLPYKGQVIFVDGSNKAMPPRDIPAHITYHQWLANEQLLPVIKAANIVVCRSGYSTLMDLVALGKRAILIPTPGQTEQEYLARQLHMQGVFYSAKQKGFELGKVLKEAAQFPYNIPKQRNAYIQYKAVVNAWIQNI